MTNIPKIDIDYDWLYDHYITKKLSTTECGMLIGCSHETIRCRLKEYGIRVRKSGEANIGKPGSNLGRKFSDEHKKRIGDSNRGKKRSDETRRKLSESHIGKFRGIPYNRTGIQLSDEHKRKISAARKGHPVSKETRCKLRKANLGKKMSEENKEKLSIAWRGKGNPNWNNGSSFGPYCPKFTNRLKERIRERHGRKCFICGLSERDAGKKSDIHHVDYNKNTLCNGKEWGLIPLCRTCHLRTNHRRWYWFGLLGNYWVYKYTDDIIYV